MSVNIKWPNKDVAELLDYSVDWTSRFIAGETIVTSLFEVSSGDVILGDQGNTDTVCTVWISGGAHLVANVITCSITTSQSRQFRESVTLETRDRSLG